MVGEAPSGGRNGAPCLVSTLGMFIIDQFRFEDEVTGEDLGDRGLGNQVGGGGTFFACGARLVLPPPDVLMIVDRGSDFTTKEQETMDELARSIDGFKSGHSLWRYRDRPEGTTRAVNIYRGEQRGFAYLTPKLRLDPIDLISESFPTFPIFIHCICAPQRARDICSQIDQRQDLWYAGSRPKIVWEPIPDSAMPENLNECLKVMSQVDVFSPNHEEAAGFLSVPKSQISGKSVRRAIETLLFDKFASSLKGMKVPVICIRSGALGSLVSQSTDKAVWVEAYHSAEQAGRVIDVTGAGNAWLGGFTAGLAKLHRNGGERKGWTDEELKLAAQMASVSASFVVEQQGLPSLQIDHEARVEKWNGEEPASRLALLQSRAKT